jgi:hypothetical protein
MVRILISYLVAHAFAAAPEESTKTEIDHQTNDFISSDLYKAHVCPEFGDVETFAQAREFPTAAADESDFFSIDVTEYIARIRALFDGVPEDREGLNIPDWNAEYKPKINRALYDFHTDIVSRTSSGASALANVVKQLHFFVAVFDAQTVDEIFQVKAKVLRDIDFIASVRESGNYTENRVRQLATFIAYADTKLTDISDNCHRARLSNVENDTYQFNTLSSVLAIARGLEFFVPDCDLDGFRFMIDIVRKVDPRVTSPTASYFIVKTRSTVGQLKAVVTECTSRL